jgi:hypothetical protein
MSEKSHTLQRWGESKHISSEFPRISFSLESYPFQMFIKEKTDLNNIYESLQIQDISIKETGGASE